VRVAVDGASSILPGSNVEALLDVEYSHAAAPQTPIRVYIATSEAANLGFIDSVQQAVTDNTCGSISLSIGVCPENADFANSADAIYQQAGTQGQTIFAAAGDDGSESLALKPKTGSCGPSGKRGVIETAASPNVTSIGGTMSKVKFDDNGIAIAGSAPETVWHETIGAGGGGKSAVFAKPTYQNGVTPKDSKRDIPDISLLAAQQTPGYIIGVNSAVQCCAGGTSFASPYWAGIDALMEQLNGGRLGTLNTQLYSLAKAGAEANGIHDVLKGNNGFKGVAGFAAKKGYDQASGWGTPDISVFAHAYTVK
jgi:subtilase family serine protease